VTRLALALALALVLAPVGGAQADDAADQAAFSAATQRLGDGDLVGARAALEALAAAAPDGRWADDALAEAANLAEQQGDRAGARRLWQRVVDEHPDGRLARRAAARLATLIEAGGADGAWDAVASEYARLVRAASAAEDPHAVLREVGALIDSNAGYPRAFDASLWLGEAWGRIAERGLAATWLDRAIGLAVTSDQRFRASEARAQLYADEGDFAAASRLLRGLDGLGRLDARARDRALAEIATRKWRGQVGQGARVALALGMLALAGLLRRRTGSWRRAARGLWPPPVEVVYLAPVAFGIALVAEGGNPLAARAVDVILGGGLAIAWVSGVALRTRATRLSTVGLLGHVIAVGLATVAVAWIAVMHDQLLDLLIETWRNGHDGR